MKKEATFRGNIRYKSEKKHAVIRWFDKERRLIKSLELAEHVHVVLFISFIYKDDNVSF